MTRALIQRWHDEFAPGLEPQPIPDGADISGPIEPLVPYGLQYRLTLPDGSSFPRHQSGPGATIAVTDGQRIALSRDYRPETGVSILKCCGGFAGKNREVATEIVNIFNRLSRAPHMTIGQHEDYLELRIFLNKLLQREYGEFRLNNRYVSFIDKPIGNPNIRICSIMGYLLISQEEFTAHAWPFVVTHDEARNLCNVRAFGDENTDRLIRRLLDF